MSDSPPVSPVSRPNSTAKSKEKTTTPPNKKTLNETRMKKLYYEDGFTLGRDTLYSVLKEKFPKDPPSKKTVGTWLKNQKIQQLFRGARNSGGAGSFKPISPWHSLSADLIDFTNKPARQWRYILVVIDNFSRFIHTRKMTGKTAEKTAKAMEDILESIKSKFGKVPTYVLSDDGPEFKSDYMKVLDKFKIQKRRTLAGQPQSNGMVERANGRIKILMAKNKKIHGGDWSQHLATATKVYNEYTNRSTKFSPSKAVDLKKDEWDILRKNVAKVQKDENREQAADLEVGETVRLKIPKGKLDKASDPSWSEKIYRIAKIHRKQATKQTSYRITGRPDDLRYYKSDLQVVNIGKIQSIPQKVKKKREKAEETPKVKRSARLKDKPEKSDRITRSAKSKPKTKTKKGEDEYEVEKVIERKGSKVLVKWKGYPNSDNTYEPITNLIDTAAYKRFADTK